MGCVVMWFAPILAHRSQFNELSMVSERNELLVFLEIQRDPP